MKSLRASLHQIKALHPDTVQLAIPQGLHSAPSSLIELMAATNPSQISSWIPFPSHEFDNETWTEECQGLTTDGKFWYISSNNEDLRAIYKFDQQFKSLGVASFPSSLGEHIGDIDYFEGTIYAPIEPTLTVAMFDTSPKFVTASPLQAGNKKSLPQTSMPWCAFNPWNGYLYSSDFDNVRQIHAYDPKNDFSYCQSLDLKGGVVHGVQGGVFSKTGRLYLTSNASKQIRAYSALNGAFLGAKSLGINDSLLEFEEVEGITIWPISLTGFPIHIHIIILDNDVNTDDVFLHSFQTKSFDNL